MLAFVSCGSKDEKSKENQEHKMEVTAADSLKLTELSTEYLNHLVKNEYDEALAMLSDFDGKNVITLSEDAKSKIMAIYRMFPAISYSVDEIIFKNETDSEIRYSIIMFETEDKNTPNKMKFLLAPKRIDGNWVLCIDDRFKTNTDQ